MTALTSQIACFAPIVSSQTENWDWVESYLSDWARWIRVPDVGLEAPAEASGFIGGGYGGGGISDQWESQAAAKAITVVDVAIDDLLPAERASVYHVHLHAVYRFRGDVRTIYEAARAKIGAKLRAADFGP